MASPGFLAATELCWLDDAAPDECRRFFLDEHPAISSVSALTLAIESLGYQLIERFPLPSSAWLDSYAPPRSRLAELRPRWAGDTSRLELLALVEREIEIYQRFGAHYGYVFFVLVSR